MCRTYFQPSRTCVTSIQFEQDGDVVTADSDGFITIYSVDADGAYFVRMEFEAHNKGISSLVMLSEGTLLSGGEKDRKIAAWDSLQNYKRITDTKVWLYLSTLLHLDVVGNYISSCVFEHLINCSNIILVILVAYRLQKERNLFHETLCSNIVRNRASLYATRSYQSRWAEFAVYTRNVLDGTMETFMWVPRETTFSRVLYREDSTKSCLAMADNYGVWRFTLTTKSLPPRDTTRISRSGEDTSYCGPRR